MKLGSLNYITKECYMYNPLASPKASRGD